MLRPFSGHPALGWVPSPPGLEVRVEIPFSCALQMRTYLGTLDVHFSDVIKGNWPLLGLFNVIFGPSRQGGRNHKNRDCAWTRRIIVSPFRILILVHIFEQTTLFPHCRVNIFRLGRSWCASTCFLPPTLVRLFPSLYTLLTCLTHFLESIEPPIPLRALLGMALDTFLCGMDRFTSGSLWSLFTRANGLRTCICVHFRWVPRIFTCLRWVLLALFTSSTNSLSLSPTFPPHFLSLFWPVPKSFICLIYASKTICSNIW